MPNQHSLPSPKDIYKQTIELITKEKIILLLTGTNVEAVIEASQVAKENGINLIGFDFRLKGAKDKLKSEKKRGIRKHGVFNIRSKKEARIATNAGATFLFSTHLDKGVIKRCRKEKVFNSTGSLTPTEVFSAHDLKADSVSIFPCSKMGGVEWISFLKEIFPKVRFIPTDRMNPAEVDGYLKAGAFAAAPIIDLEREENPEGLIKEFSRIT